MDKGPGSNRSAVIPTITYPDGMVLEGDIQILGTITCPTEVLCVKYTAGYEYLAVGLINGKIGLYSMPSGTLSKTLFQKTAGSSVPVTSIKHRASRKRQAPSKTITAAYVDGSIRSWDIFSGEMKFHIKEKRQVLGLAYNTELNKFITVGDDTKINLYDEETTALEAVFEASDIPECMDGHMSRTFAATFNPRQPYEFITGGWDDTIQFWDVRHPRSLQHCSGAHMCGDGLDISKNGKQIMSCSWQRENPVQIWDYATAKLLLNLNVDSYESKLYCGRYLPKDSMIMGGTDPSLVRIIEKGTLLASARIRGLESGVYGIDLGLPTKRRNLLKAGSEGFTPMPKVSFCAGNKVFEFDFT